MNDMPLDLSQSVSQVQRQSHVAHVHPDKHSTSSLGTCPTCSVVSPLSLIHI